MTRKKQKNVPRPFWRYLLDEYILFRHDFAWDTDLSPEEAAEEIRQLAYEKTDGLRKERRIISEMSGSGDDFAFEVRAEQPAKRGYSQNASASGRIILDDDGRTLVEGSVVMSGATNWFGIAVLLGVIIIFVWQGGPVAVWWVPVLMYTGMMVYFFRKMYSDRNHLFQIIANSIRRDKTRPDGQQGSDDVHQTYQSGARKRS